MATLYLKNIIEKKSPKIPGSDTIVGIIMQTTGGDWVCKKNGVDF